MRTLVDPSLYVFSKAAKTITFTGETALAIERVLAISNLTRSVDMYDPTDPNLGGTMASGVLTLELDTNTASFADADKLQIFVEWDEVFGRTTGTAVVTDATGTIQQYLRGLIKVFADVWDSSNHWLNVSLKSKLQNMIGSVENDTIGVSPTRRSDAFDSALATADATTAVLVKALTLSKAIYLTDVAISTDTAGWVQLEDTDGTIVVSRKYLPANCVWSKSYVTPKLMVTAKGLYVKAQNAGNITVGVNGYVI